MNECRVQTSNAIHYKTLNRPGVPGRFGGNKSQFFVLTRAQVTLSYAVPQISVSVTPPLMPRLSSSEGRLALSFDRRKFSILEMDGCTLRRTR